MRPLTQDELIEQAVGVLQSTTFYSNLDQQVTFMKGIFNCSTGYGVLSTIHYDEVTGQAQVSRYDCGFLIDSYETEHPEHLVSILISQVTYRQAYSLMLAKRRYFHSNFERIKATERLFQTLVCEFPEPYKTYVISDGKVFT